MSDNPPVNVNNPRSGRDEKDDKDEKPAKKGGFSRWMLIGLGAVTVIIILLFVVAIIGGMADSEGVSNFFRILRDFFIIVLALQGIVICLALVILVLQVAALINLLNSEVQPIVDETRETISTARGTIQFVGKNVAEPVIRIASSVSFARAFVGELLGIRRNLIGRGK